ncbi:hypothetical protein TWF696_006791 [Orbilia brochopaga]|uniref:Uncharacterized protein n=1 Tax=Orbilia brochopaga TaxID=3140254 RepID=A0AAV9UPX9_9PEZI
MPSANVNPNPADATNALLQAIDAAPRHHLRLILQSLCTDPSTLRRAQTLFSRLSRSSITSPPTRKRKLNPTDSETSTNTHKKSTDKKHKCIRCNTLFNPDTQGPSTRCIYHPGNLLVDLEADVWTAISRNKDRKTPLQIDYTDEGLIEKYPEGYRYDCCDEYADHDGCQRGPHITSEANYTKQWSEKSNSERYKWKEKHNPAKRVKREDTDDEETEGSDTDQEE